MGVNDAPMSTIYNLVIFGSALLVIAVMLFMGSIVNKKKVTHEFWNEKILQEEQRLKEEKDRAAQKLANAEKLASMIQKN